MGAVMPDGASCADRPRGSRFFDPKLFVTFLLAMIPVLLSGLVWGVSVESRLSVQQEQIKSLVDYQRVQDDRATATLNGVREDIKDVGRKVDRILELAFGRQHG